MGGTRVRIGLIAALTVLVVGLGPGGASAHPGPQGSQWSKCKGWVGQGHGSFTGTIYGVPRTTFQQFYVKMVSSPVVGWTGSWTINNASQHDMTAIPAGLYHWMPSPAIQIPARANAWFSPHARDLFAPFSNCGGGTGCDGGGGYQTANYGYRVDVSPLLSIDTDYGVEIWTTGYRCD